MSIFGWGYARITVRPLFPEKGVVQINRVYELLEILWYVPLLSLLFCTVSCGKLVGGLEKASLRLNYT